MIPLDGPTKDLEIEVTWNEIKSACHESVNQTEAYSLILSSENAHITCKLVSAPENKLHIISYPIVFILTNKEAT